LVQVVFNQRGDREAALTAAAQDMVDAFLVLLRRLVEPPGSSVRDTQQRGEQGESASQGNESEVLSTAILLAAFDEAWVAYLEQFVAWKFADAASLEVRPWDLDVEIEKNARARERERERERERQTDRQRERERERTAIHTYESGGNVCS
jgi:hypothetical protein